MPTYLDYVTNTSHMQAYTEYQHRYSTQIRESDKVLIDIVRGIRDEKVKTTSHPALLDIGCSTGNLLLHLKRLIPEFSLVGGDMVTDVIDECSANEKLSGIKFEVMDATRLDRHDEFDVIVANATLGVVDEEQFDRAIASISQALRKDGCLVIFDWLHTFAQELTITERSDNFPNGLTWRSRSYERVAGILSETGFAEPRFDPFYIPIDLEMSDDPRSIRSHSVTTHDGRRLSFRGALCQPWCHMTAQKI